MKTLIGALALFIAVPAAAQTAPAAAPQAGHAQHQTMDHSQHMAGMDHSQHMQGKHDCKACCEKMKGKDGKMECMDDKKSTAASAPASSAPAHAAH